MISLPTEGHYRRGRYMPVRVEGATPTDSISVLGGGTIPTEINHPDSPAFTIPWLIAGDLITDPRWQAAGGPPQLPLVLHPLASDERLVGFAGTSQELAQLLFPGNTIVPVQLDESELLEPVEAWECLDAVVLSSSAAARLDEARLATLLAGGTIIAVRSDAAPTGHWPWQRRGGYWVLQYRPAGPQPIVEPEAYQPTYSWDRGWPGAFRRRVLFAAVLFSILSLASLLYRSRWTAITFVAVCLVFIAALAVWSSRQSPVLQLSSAVRVEAGPISQFDLWTWQSPVRAADVSFRVSGLTEPFLASIKQIDETRLRLVCQSNGRPAQFDCHLEPMQSLAFLSRQVRPSSALPVLTAAPARSLDFAEALYPRPQSRVVGQYLAGAAGTPVTVIQDGPP